MKKRKKFRVGWLIESKWMNKMKDLVESIYAAAMFDYGFDVTCEAVVKLLKWRPFGFHAGGSKNVATRRFEFSVVASP